MKEFKLLDLNEGKILELGKDFLYGGEYIAYIEDIDGDKVDLESFDFGEYSIKMDYICVHKTPFSQSIHTKLIPILEKTGAELFGDRYVLMEKDKTFTFTPFKEIADKVILIYDKAMKSFYDERLKELNRKEDYNLNEEEDIYLEANYYFENEADKDYRIILKSYGQIFSSDLRFLPERYHKGEIYSREEAYEMILKELIQHKDWITKKSISFEDFYKEYSFLLKGEPNKFDEFC